MKSLSIIRPRRILRKAGHSGGEVGLLALRTLVAGAVFMLSAGLVCGQSQGLLQTGSMTVDTSPGGPVHVSTTNNSYDVRGNLVETVSKSADTQQLTTWSYDKHGQVETETVWQFQGVTMFGCTTDYINLGSNQWLSVIRGDFDNAGNTNTPKRTITTYNGEGKPVLQSEEFDDDVDGTVDRRFISEWNYDFDQHQMIYTQEQDLDADGTFDSHTRLVYILDKNGRPVSWDGYVANIRRPSGRVYSRGTNSYDKFGNLLKTETVIRSNGQSGTSQFFSTTTYFYAHRGEVVRAAGRARSF
jgi:hypothetical protein